MKSMGIWVEITTLIVPGINDDPGELKAIAKFICQSLGAGTPWHISRFYPQFRMTDRPPTKESVLLTTRDMGRSVGLKYIYLGNIASSNHTFCPDCDSLLVRRAGYSTRIVGVDAEGMCLNCGAELDGRMFS